MKCFGFGFVSYFPRMGQCVFGTALANGLI